jgi:CBS domain-containing protein
MNVASVMTPRSEVVVVELPGTRDDALEYLQDRQFSSVPVVKNTDGTESYRGLLTRNALIEQPEEDQVALLMDEVPTTTGDVSLEAAAELMLETDTRRVPVVDGGDGRIGRNRDGQHHLQRNAADRRRTGTRPRRRALRRCPR